MVITPCCQHIIYNDQRQKSNFAHLRSFLANVSLFFMNIFLGLLLSQLSKNGRFYMKNHSFTEGCVVVQLANESFNVLFETADLVNMTIKLKMLPKASTRVVDSQTLRYFVS